MADFKLTPDREKELEKIAKDLPDADFKKRYGKDWKSVKIATAMNILKKKLGFKEENMKKFKEFRAQIGEGKEFKKSKFSDDQVMKAIDIAMSMGGAMTPAFKKIEKIARGLGDDYYVSRALKLANEDVNELSKKKRIDMIRKAVERVKKKNDAKAKKDAMRMMKQAGMFDENIQEGTWSIPDNRNELAMLSDMLMTPFPATKPNDLDKFLDKFPVGDDSLYDEIDSQMYEKESDGSVKRPLKKVNKFPKVFLNVIAGESLMKNKWIRGKTSGNKFKMTHHSFGPLEDVSEEDLPSRPKAKRKSGNIKKKPMQKLMMSEGVKADPLDRAERVLNYKLKELQYKSELRRFNEYEEDKVKQYRMEANNAPLAKRAEKRFKGMDKRLAQRVANAVKPGRMINSKLYMELGDLWDKGDKKGFEKHLKKSEK